MYFNQIHGISYVFDDLVQPEAWNVRNSWTGPNAVLYQSFDDSDGYVLMEGIQQMGCVPVISGKVGNFLL